MYKTYNRYQGSFKFSCVINSVINIQHLVVPQKINSDTINPKAFLLFLGHIIALFTGFLRVTALFPLKIVCLTSITVSL